MLIGLSAKNAILIVQFAVANYEKGLSIAESAVQAARLRFRPIIMTALAFIFGCLPLWTASGSGAVSRRILGTVVIGGMTLASVVGILLVPVIVCRSRVSFPSVRGWREKSHDGFDAGDAW